MEGYFNAFKENKILTLPKLRSIIELIRLKIGSDKSHEYTLERSCEDY